MTSKMHCVPSNRTPLECSRIGISQYKCAADKSTEIPWCSHVNMHQNLKGMFWTFCGIHDMKSWDCSENKGSPSLLLWCSWKMHSEGTQICHFFISYCCGVKLLWSFEILKNTVRDGSFRSLTLTTEGTLHEQIPPYKVYMRYMRDIHSILYNFKM